MARTLACLIVILVIIGVASYLNSLAIRRQAVLIWWLNGEKSELKLYISPNLFKYATLLKHTVKNKICFVQKNVKLFPTLDSNFNPTMSKSCCSQSKKNNFLLDYFVEKLFIVFLCINSTSLLLTPPLDSVFRAPWRSKTELFPQFPNRERSSKVR